ncbi:hypothetical protein [Psychroserpens sp. NJDZ02]|uniref:hypothetical protein n=1 Tax=Psychroserpens sp. NJDZ02 TaxID=2570561 RepID=UPI0010A84B77|nr:hypothetical protein [Psychroserpens sp. NJDZ02]QCE40053.1 hypothetical protein E9099_00985 [Psychroserpens sp. NJDZ02]
MSILKKIFGNKSTHNKPKLKKQYLAGWEVNLDGKEHCLSFIETQITDKQTAESMYSHIILTYDENNFLEFAESRDEDENNEELIIRDDQIKYRDLRINKIFNFEKAKNGENWIGGNIPSDFLIPKNTCPGSFQYLGKLSKESKAYDWLPFDINLICPIYLDLDKIWLDYSEPNSPKILNIEEVNSLSTAYDDLNADSFIEYEQVRFTTKEDKAIGYEIGFSGIPNWIQYSDIPKCPKTQKTMRFLCQLQSSDEIKTKETNIKPTDEWYKQYFEKMNFWGDGDLFVFFEPESKIACYMIQNT